MKIFKLKTINFLVIAAMAITVFVTPAFASTTDGTIDSTDKYAWSENVGWINFGTTEGNVNITDSSLTGYAWSPKAGWISLNCSNDSFCATVDHKVANDGAGNLSGYAWGENVGWINFNPTGGGVNINSSGEFSGYAFGPKIGWIVFNCITTSSCATVDYKVKTDWRPQISRPQCNNSLDDDGDGKTDYPNDPGCSSLDDDDETDPGGGLPPGASNPPSQPEPTPENPEGGFGVLINPSTSSGQVQGDEYTTIETVILRLNAGIDAERMAISNTEDFEYASQILYEEEISWKLSSGRDEALPRLYDGEYIVYAKFYTQHGVSSEVVSDSIILDTTSPEITISNLKDFYQTDESIFLYGASEPYAKIMFSLDDYIANETNADNNGYWSINLNKLSEGSHILKLTPQDKAGNIGNALQITFAVKEKTVIQPEKQEKEIKPEIPETEIPEIKPEEETKSEEKPIKPEEEIISEEEPTEPELAELEPAETIESQKPSVEEISESKDKLSQDEPQKSVFFIGSLWQQIKTASQHAYKKTVAGFNNFNKSVANFTKGTKDKFMAFVGDIKIIGNEIKIAIIDSSQPIQISGVKAIPLSSTSVEIIWETNHKATGKVNYGFSRIYDQEKQDSKKVKNHSIILNNLKPDTAYHYEVISQNGSYAYDADRMFYTPSE